MHARRSRRAEASKLHAAAQQSDDDAQFGVPYFSLLPVAGVA